MRLRLVALAALLAGCGGVSVGSPPYDPVTGSAFGTVTRAEPLEPGIWRVALDAEFVACERNATAWEGRVLAPVDLAPGMRIGAQEDQGLNTVGYWPDLAAYAEACRERHAHDVRTTPLRPEAPPQASGAAVQLRGAALAVGARTEASLGLLNQQDVPLVVELADLLVVNDQAYQASAWTGRVQPLCAVEPREARVEVPPGAAAPLRVTLDCPADADPRAPYPECERAYGANDTPTPGACHDVTPHSSLASVVGRLAFVDELGHRHERAGLLWQFFEVGEAARLEVDAPAVARRPEDVVVRVRYVDADGRPIERGYAYAGLLLPGIAGHQFSLPREGDAHVFRWDTMAEWTPRRWPTGDVDLVVEAQDEHGRHLSLAWRGSIRFE